MHSIFTICSSFLKRVKCVVKFFTGESKTNNETTITALYQYSTFFRPILSVDHVVLTIVNKVSGLESLNNEVATYVYILQMMIFGTDCLPKYRMQ